jgi:hypothetical protein
MVSSAHRTAGEEVSGTPVRRNLSSLVSAPVPQAPAEWAEEVGDMLFRTVFTGEVRSLFDEACGRRHESKLGLRIRIHFDPSSESGARLADLPWELLYRADRKDFLGLSGLFPVVRHLEVTRPLELGPLKPPLLVVVARFNPADTTPLQLENEEREVKDALGGVEAMDLRFLRAASAEQLHDALRETEVHVLHLMGHGEFDVNSGTGTLLLEGAPGGIPLAGEMLARLVRDRLPRLVVVNACSTARSSGPAPFAGVATALVLAGVPAVIAMRLEISNRAALVFAKILYTELARHRPLEAAVAEGRLAIYRSDPGSLDWTLPVLFLRAPSEDIFPVSSAPDPSREPRTPPLTSLSAPLPNVTIVGPGQQGIVNSGQGASIKTGNLTFKR